MDLCLNKTYKQQWPLSSLVTAYNSYFNFFPGNVRCHANCHNCTIKLTIRISALPFEITSTQNVSYNRKYGKKSISRLISLYFIVVYLCRFWTHISQRFFTCNWASEASLWLLLAHKYGQEVLDLNANFRLWRESLSSVIIKLALTWDFSREYESYTLALYDATLRMLPRQFTRLFAPSKSDSYVSPAVFAAFNTEVIFSSASAVSFCEKQRTRKWTNLFLILAKELIPVWNQNIARLSNYLRFDGNLVNDRAGKGNHIWHLLGSSDCIYRDGGQKL